MERQKYPKEVEKYSPKILFRISNLFVVSIMPMNLRYCGILRFHTRNLTGFNYKAYTAKYS